MPLFVFFMLILPHALLAVLPGKPVHTNEPPVRRAPENRCAKILNFGVKHRCSASLCLDTLLYELTVVKVSDTDKAARGEEEPCPAAGIFPFQFRGRGRAW
ncbi:hypothetical protein B9Z19DRAFT_1086515 [Tuber borchii]|uniref:Secreted protein n=1 Tax=Tuber borchii TaxID=42251 RepID=A0A2T6ZPG3_TUBBO|nr:hypothetical protein B9Z19DRAFT_1086515 [Tuber borchii]